MNNYNAHEAEWEIARLQAANARLRLDLEQAKSVLRYIATLDGRTLCSNNHGLVKRILWVFWSAGLLACAELAALEASDE